MAITSCNYSQFADSGVERVPTPLGQFNVINISLLIFILFASCYCHAIGFNDETTTKKASNLVMEYINSDSHVKKGEVVCKLHKLYNNDQDNINIVRMYTEVLSSEGKYHEAINVLSLFNSKNKNPSLLLNECMLKDRMGNNEPSCYAKVISLKEASNKKDIDYLMALFMTNDKRFDKEKRIYMKGRNDNHDMEIFKYNKRKVLSELYPD